MKKPYNIVEDSGLIIGGSHDGEVRLGIDKWAEYMELVVYEPASPFPYKGIVEECEQPLPTVRKEVYRREMIRGSEKTWSLWVHQSLSSDQALDHLLKGYRRA